MSYILYICTISLFTLTSLSFAILSSSSALADTSTVSSATVTVSETCAMTGTVNTPHTAELVNGTYSGLNYTNGIGQTTLKVFCNDGAGFAIYAIGYTNNEYGNNYMHWNKATTTSDHTNDIATGIYSSGASTSSWSMKLASVAGAYAATIDDGVSANNNSTDDFTNWHTIPTEYKRVAYRTSGTDVEISGQGTGSSITVTYDAFVSGTQPAGTYIGQVKYTMVHPNMSDNSNKPVRPLDPSLCPANFICYVPNTGDIEGTMVDTVSTYRLSAIANYPKAGKQSGTMFAGGGGAIVGRSTAQLIPPNYKRDGYGFVGWSTDYEVTEDSVIYGPNETINIDSTNGGLDLSTHGLILYPVWLASSGDLQGWSGCSSLEPVAYDTETGAISATFDSVTALRDTRDGNVYAVARLADGNCWMVENLRLNAENSRGAANAAKSQGYGTGATYGDFVGLANSEDSSISSTVTRDTDPIVANSIYYAGTQSGTASINIAQTDYAGFRIPRYNNNNTNIGGKNSAGVDLVPAYTSTSIANQWYSYGNFYTWAAAVASTAFYEAGSNVTGTSICPSGWYLPLGDISTGVLDDGSNDSANYVGSFSYLDRKMGGTGANSSKNSVTNVRMDTSWRAFPNNFVFSGAIGDVNGDRRFVEGYYWTAKAGGTGMDSAGAFYKFAYAFDLSNLYINMSAGERATAGYSVRCLTQ